MKFIKRFLRDEKGQALPLFALLAVVLIAFAGLAVDVGGAYVSKSNLQKAVDAAALAGAKDLPNAAVAKDSAIYFAGLNGLSSAETENIVNVTTPYKGDKSKIEVVGSKRITYTFARVLGFKDVEVRVRSVATKATETLPKSFTDYAIFSESKEIALNIGKAGNGNIIKGTVHTNNQLNLGKHQEITRAEANKGIVQDKNSKNVLHSFDENSPIVMIPEDFKTALIKEVELVTNKYIGNQKFDNLNSTESIYVKGNVTITGNHIKANGFIYATGNIKISGNNMNIGSRENPVFIFSDKNVIIDGNNPVIYGVIFAPNGTIDVQKNNWQLFGSLIGKSFTEDCLKNNFSITTGLEYFSAVPYGDVTTRLIE